MDVILLQRIDRLGQMGDVVKVRPGYARNYLLPQRKAVRATDENRKMFEAQRVQLEADNLSRKAEAEAAAAKMEGLAVTLTRQAGEAGQLYGSVSARDIAAAVTEAGFSINRQQVRLAAPIKDLGLHPVFVSLHPEVVVTVTANVARTEEEAALQLDRGAALTRAALEAEEEAAEAAAEAALASPSDEAELEGELDLAEVGEGTEPEAADDEPSAEK